MPKIEFVRFRRAPLEVEDGSNLMRSLLSSGIPVASSCQGDGVCGKCALRVLAKTGVLPDRTPLEKELLIKANRDHAEYRISCQLQLTQDILVDADYW